MEVIPLTTLNSGVEMPQLGLGLARVPDRDAVAAVRAALEIGYRSVDTAKDYGNEVGVGRALSETDVPRSELFITTKVWNADHGRDATMRAFDASLKRLCLEYVDLYLIHWPVPEQDLYIETWLALEELYAAGRARSIGVSNFEPGHLDRLLQHSSVTPALNQIELHPRLQQAELEAFHREHGIATEAWSPLAKGRSLLEPTLVSLAERRRATPAQIILRWHLQVRHIVVTKTVNAAHMRENLGALALEPLNEEELMEFQELDNNGRIGPHPDYFR